MKRFGVLPALVMVLAIPAMTAHAVPSMDAATDFACVGSTGQTSVEPYQYHFVNTFISGTDAHHAFVVGASASNPSVFTNWVGPGVNLHRSSDIPAGHFGVLLGALSRAWSSMSADILTFAVADANADGPKGNGNTGPNYDPFSPKNASATGAPVPEPGTFLLLGAGLIGLAGWGGKFSGNT